MSYTKRQKRAARATRRKRTKRPFNPSARLWTLPDSADWSGIPYKILLRLVKAGVIQAVTIGDKVKQTMPNGQRRVRACAKFLILSKPFITWVDGLGAGDKLAITKGEAA